MQKSRTRTTKFVGLVTVLLCSLVLSRTASAQSSGIAGMVNDTSGAVLPGVTVEAASPALIEKVRTVITDGQGRYNIVDLRPGTYAVTFSLAGFNTSKREGVVLSAGFTATINATMAVGALEETITVAGASPLVDTQNARQISVVSNDLLAVLPTGHNTVGSMVQFTPGMTGRTDVGGVTGTLNNQGSSSTGFHGITGKGKTTYDGMRVADQSGNGGVSYIIPQYMVQETTIETGGATADSSVSGILINSIPKDGGNAYHFDAFATYTNGNFQSVNSTVGQSALKPPGVLLTRIYDVTGTVGGPIKRDRVWFFGGTMQSENTNLGIYHNKVQGTPAYVPDTSNPSHQFEYYRSYSTRVTFQVSKKNKINVFQDWQYQCQCRIEGGAAGATTPNLAPEAQKFVYWDQAARYGKWPWPLGLTQFSWSAPLTNRLLFEAGYAAVISHYRITLAPSVTPNDVNIVESTTGLSYNSFSQWNPHVLGDRFPARFSVSYITGTHAIKTGLQLEQGTALRQNAYNRDQSWIFQNGRPSTITQYVSPYQTLDKNKADLGIFVQDQWAMKRMTLNYGLRFDYFNAYTPAQSLPARQFATAQSYPEVDKIPEWFDLNPRLGAAFDLFGTGRTALKVSVGRYAGVTSTDIAVANDPIVTSVVSANRNWADNGDFIPQCDLTNFAANGECGAILNSNFGKNNPNAAKYADDVLRGWGVRDYLWNFAAEVQHEVTSGISVHGGYYRNWLGNFRVTDNVLIGPQDFSPYCITAPSDPRLPNGGGYQICDLYDIVPSKATLSQTVVTQASHFGKQTQVSDFFDAGISTRLSGGIRFGGGVDWGRTVSENCFTVDSPQQEKATIDGQPNCRAVKPWLANLQVKLFGSYPLPAGFSVSGTFQNIGGPPITASYSAPNAIIAPSLGRNLAACGAAATCNSSATVPLVLQGALFAERLAQTDMRLSRTFKVRQYRMILNLDAYNLFNANAPTVINTTFGPLWQDATTVMGGRLIEFGGSVQF